MSAHAITNGRVPAERIEQVATFTGQAFRIPQDNVQPLLVFGEQAFLLEPDENWKFTDDTPKKSISGWLQGAALELGDGRIAIFGEAGMFTAQRSGPQRRPMGMNSPLARQNAQFALNVMHWLTDVE